MAISETMERMALAVMKGDEAAALALADALQEGRQAGERLVVPVRRVASGQARALVFFDKNAAFPDSDELEAIGRAMNEWLEGPRRVMAVMPGVERIELYEFVTLDAAPPPAP